MREIVKTVSVHADGELPDFLLTNPNSVMTRG